MKIFIEIATLRKNPNAGSTRSFVPQQITYSSMEIQHIPELDAISKIIERGSAGIKRLYLSEEDSEKAHKICIDSKQDKNVSFNWHRPVVITENYIPEPDWFYKYDTCVCQSCGWVGKYEELQSEECSETIDDLNEYDEEYRLHEICPRCHTANCLGFDVSFESIEECLIRKVKMNKQIKDRDIKCSICGKHPIESLKSLIDRHRMLYGESPINVFLNFNDFQSTLHDLINIYKYPLDHRAIQFEFVGVQIFCKDDIDYRTIDIIGKS